MTPLCERFFAPFNLREHVRSPLRCFTTLRHITPTMLEERNHALEISLVFFSYFLSDVLPQLYNLLMIALIVCNVTDSLQLAS